MGGEITMSPELRAAVAGCIDEAFIPQWLDTPNPTLRGRTPAAVIAAGEERLIWAALERLWSGDCS